MLLQSTNPLTVLGLFCWTGHFSEHSLASLSTKEVTAISTRLSVVGKLRDVGSIGVQSRFLCPKVETTEIGYHRKTRNNDMLRKQLNEAYRS